MAEGVNRDSGDLEDLPRVEVRKADQDLESIRFKM